MSAEGKGGQEMKMGEGRVLNPLVGATTTDASAREGTMPGDCYPAAFAGGWRHDPGPGEAASPHEGGARDEGIRSETCGEGTEMTNANDNKNAAEYNNENARTDATQAQEYATMERQRLSSTGDAVDQRGGLPGGAPSPRERPP